MAKAVLSKGERWSSRLGDTSESNGEHMCRAGTIKAKVFEQTHPEKGRVPGTGPGRAAQLLTVCDDRETQVTKMNETVDCEVLLF